jgi:hypothetical protein
MEVELTKYLSALNKGDKISLVIPGTIVDGILDEVIDNCVVLSEATSQINKKKQYHLIIPIGNIYAWGQKQKKKKAK